MTIKQNISIEGLHSKPILLDAIFVADKTKKPLVIFSHGFKGFKDWGVFNLLAIEMARKGFVFVKFNFSHNGTTVDDPLNFGDLGAFSDNTFSKELDDLGSVIDWVCSDEMYIPSWEKDINRIYLIGHSRGGGISILKTNEDMRVTKLATWASVSVFGKYWNEETMEQWKKDGVMIIKNSRTKQDMPMKFKLYEDYYDHMDRLYIPTAVKNIDRPFLVIHGDGDESVDVSNAEDIHKWNPRTELKILKGQGHTFGAKHPWEQSDLPQSFQKLIDLTTKFFNEDD